MLPGPVRAAAGAALRNSRSPSICKQRQRVALATKLLRPGYDISKLSTMEALVESVPGSVACQTHSGKDAKPLVWISLQLCHVPAHVFVVQRCG